MKLHVDALGESPTELRLDPEPGWWQETCALLPELPAGEPESFHVALRAHRMGSDLYLEGTLVGALELVCGRCTRRYRQPLREPLRLVLEPVGERAPTDPEGAASLARDGLWLGDELEAGWFRGPVVDLGAYLREVVALALPVQPRCREECRGLCPRCGADRNLESCRCEAEPPHSPFAVLAGLKVSSEGGGG
jgi:uncharacterized protein